jgi:3-deoxy-manno-octulosonate cytidylyltransferase (CMP-KDO synthetase)|tara:strand:+ start:550 stop:1296 length:747 start_codon:yes stop_codon:yes gene_type:complete
MSFCVIIPARYKSKRLPGKPLIKINGKTLIERTYQNLIKRIEKKNIFITSDSKLVLDEMKQHTNNLILINKYCKNGTERCSYALDKIPKQFKYLLICSCDMPFLTEESINFIISKKTLLKQKNLDGITMHAKINSKKTYNDHSIAKVVLNKYNEILYLSRSPIPFGYKKRHNYLSHHGLVILKREILSRYKKYPKSTLEASEDNEWLRLIENGYKIKSFLFKKLNPEINTKKDLKKYFLHNFVKQKET